MGETVKKDGIFRRIGKSIKGTKSEFKKVVWPTKSQLLNNTLIVIAALIIIGLVIFGLDTLFTWIAGKFLLRRRRIMRVKITLACTECKQRNYNTIKNKKNNPDRLEMNKYCPFCRKHTLHKESK